jgi:hypothetical protein
MVKGGRGSSGRQGRVVRSACFHDARECCSFHQPTALERQLENEKTRREFGALETYQRGQEWYREDFVDK